LLDTAPGSLPHPAVRQPRHSAPIRLHRVGDGDPTSEVNIRYRPTKTAKTPDRERVGYLSDGGCCQALPSGGCGSGSASRRSSPPPSGGARRGSPFTSSLRLTTSRAFVGAAAGRLRW
jgi:hypothetical protein